MHRVCMVLLWVEMGWDGIGELALDLDSDVYWDAVGMWMRMQMGQGWRFG